MKKLIYIFDVDKTILSDVGHSYEKAIPLPGRIAKVNALYENGHTIIYWTARGATTGTDWHEFTFNQLVGFGCKFHEFKTGKPHYDVWVDDKATNSEVFF